MVIPEIFSHSASGPRPRHCGAMSPFIKITFVFQVLNGFLNFCVAANNFIRSGLFPTNVPCMFAGDSQNVFNPNRLWPEWGRSAPRMPCVMPETNGQKFFNLLSPDLNQALHMAASDQRKQYT